MSAFACPKTESTELFPENLPRLATAAAEPEARGVRMGRPRLCTPGLLAGISAYIRLEGISDSAAGLLAGVSTSTLSRWKQEDEEVAIALGQARALYEMERTRAIRQMTKRDGTLDWRAQAWLLQHSSPEVYGTPSRRRLARVEREMREQQAEAHAAGPGYGESGTFLPESLAVPGEEGSVNRDVHRAKASSEQSHRRWQTAATREGSPDAPLGRGAPEPEHDDLAQPPTGEAVYGRRAQCSPDVASQPTSVSAKEPAASASSDESVANRPESPTQFSPGSVMNESREEAPCEISHRWPQTAATNMGAPGAPLGCGATWLK